MFRKLAPDGPGPLRGQGKAGQLEISGKETELDKGIVDGLGEPLAHIIRNMIDHGIEGPEERSAAGKPEEGLHHSSGYTMKQARLSFESSDDGRGIDTEKLKKRAVEQGLLTG